MSNWHYYTPGLTIDAYIADGEFFCRDCAVKRYGADAVDNATPYDEFGNTVGVLFSIDEGPLDEEPWEFGAPDNVTARRSRIECGECGTVLREAGEWY